MNQVYKYSRYSKQAFHQKMNRLLKEHERTILLLPLIEEMREEHPGMSARKLHLLLRPSGLGRDKFERLCFEHGFKLKRERAFSRTTDSTGVIRFPNLLLGRELTHVNQAWVSDITYYQIGSKFYYLTFIMDLYSRVIVGHSISKTLSTAETTLPALRQAIEYRKPPAGLIFHSDGGGQYYCREFLALTKHYQLSNSMCDVVFDNPHAERINGTIKNQYVKGYNPKNYDQLKAMTNRAVNNYNTIRPHDSLKKQSPKDFEKRSSLLNDDFCIANNTTQLHQKNHHLSKSLTNKYDKKPVYKTVNVIQA